MSVIGELSYIFFIVLSLFMTPEDLNEIRLDCLNVKPGYVETVLAERTESGFVVYFEQKGKQTKWLNVARSKESDFVFEVINEENGKCETIDFRDVKKQIESFDKKSRQKFSISGNDIWVTASGKARYVYKEKDGIWFVVH